jgi:phosphoribosylaminoimidazole (AIR) synthetase
MNMINYSSLYFETAIVLLYSTITVPVGYSTIRKICTRIRKSKKDKKNTMTKRKGQKDKQRPIKHTHTYATESMVPIG